MTAPRPAPGSRTERTRPAVDHLAALDAEPIPLNAPLCEKTLWRLTDESAARVLGPARCG